MLREFTLNGFGNHSACALFSVQLPAGMAVYFQKRTGEICPAQRAVPERFCGVEVRRTGFGCLKSRPEDTATSPGGEVSFEPFIKGQG